MQLSIIIVNYNVQYFLENCLNSVLQASKNSSTEVFVVDNNSVDGSLKMLASKFPEVQLIANKDNKGFSRANNQAIKRARGEFVLLLNPDTVVEESTFEKCISFFESHQEAGGLGVKMLDGKGNFLPESKRGLPTPAVAFYKIFGLSALFPKSKKFGQYHLGHLSKNSNQEIDILSGAFMMIRKSVLDKIGLLDESFFMYGEDIDLSYRITQAGYKNYYLSETSIIHYKGESTKKSSINYVFVFYRAMAIFARKHFSNQNAKLFSSLINFAIYVRAFLAVVTRTAKHLLLAGADFLLLFLGIRLFIEYYAENIKFTSGGSYPYEFVFYGVTILSAIYLAGLFTGGAYSIPTRLKDIFRGTFIGSLLVLISYSLISEEYRFSRAVIIFSVLWNVSTVPLLRYVLHLFKLRRLSSEKPSVIAIAGSEKEVERIHKLLKSTLVDAKKIITVEANSDKKSSRFPFDGKLYQLRDIIEIYNVTEVIFCSEDIPASEIILHMSILSNQQVNFKIAPPESLYIIGSNSIENSGEYYIVDSNVLLKPINQKNKRVFDFLSALFLIIFSPVFIWFNTNKINYFSNCLAVLSGRLSWVGFELSQKLEEQNLKLKKGVFSPASLFQNKLAPDNLEKMNFNYARDYNIAKDLEIVVKNIAQIGKKSTFEQNS